MRRKITSLMILDGFLNFRDYVTFDDNLSTDSSLYDDSIIELVNMEEETQNKSLTPNNNDNSEDNNYKDLEKCFNAIECKLVQSEGVSHNP